MFKFERKPNKFYIIVIAVKFKFNAIEKFVFQTYSFEKYFGITYVHKHDAKVVTISINFAKSAYYKSFILININIRYCISKEYLML